ncbi:Rossmann-like domain-containing protein [Thermodesulfobacteriota bacterium]
MKILDDVMSTLNFNAALKDIRQGVFHTGVLTRNCGLAATLPRDALRQTHPMVKEPGFLLDKGTEELARLSYSESILEAAMGMATINSLLEINEDDCIELNGADLILEKGEGRNVAIVGHFPFISRIRGALKELWVIEKNPREGDFHEADAENLIPRADVVGITGTAITNHTIEHLLRLCSSSAYVIVLGDTAPLSPILLDHGIDAVSGTKVMDPVLALRCVSEGANFRQIKGIKRLTLMR